MTLLNTVGHLTIDDIVLYTGETHMGTIGGAALYAAVGARVWTTKVGLVARLASDYPEEGLATLERLGFELYLCPVGYLSIKNWALYEENGRRTFILRFNSGGYDELAVRPEDMPPSVLDAGACHIAPMPTEHQGNLAKFFKKHGRLVSLDPHFDYITGHEDEFYSMLGDVDLFLPSREEAALGFGRDDPEAAIVEFARAGPRIVAIKLASEGSLVYNAETRTLAHIPIVHTSVVDVTGAGDSYCGGFATAYLLHGDATLAGCCGTVSASYVVEHLGAPATLEAGFSDAQERLHKVQDGVAISQVT